MKKTKLLLVLVIIAAGIGGFVFWKGHSSKAVIVSSSTKTTKASQTTPAPVSGFNKNQYPLDDPASIWVVVNKQRALNPVNYTPANLTVPKVPLRVPGNESMQVAQPTATALETMFAAAKADGINLMVSSGYRSYTYQVGLYNGYVKSQGQATADTQSARPGHSEHQTGWAADLEPVSRKCELQQCFADTPEGK
jgi:D-alanyl-D-alanine carboxypeptidase